MVLNALLGRDLVYSPGEDIGGYIVDENINQGRYGICYIVVKDSNKYVLKQLKRKILKKIAEKSIFEVEILKKMDHPQIPKLIDVIDIKGYTNYILEYKQGKTIEELLYEDEYSFTQDEIFKITSKLIDLIKYLHDNNVVHRDIRVPNIIYNEGNINLLDFGLARIANNKRYTFETDYEYLADFMLHLYYSSFEDNSVKGKSWHEELDLPTKHKAFLKKLFGIDSKFNTIDEIKEEYSKIMC